MSGKGSMSRTPGVSLAEYGDNFDRIFGGDTRKWGHAHTKGAESWQSDDATTREDAIADGRDYYNGEAFAICRCNPIDPLMTLPDADDIAEQMAESAGDNYGWVEDFPDVSQAGLDELNKLLQTWARKHVTTHYWIAEDVEEVPALDESSPEAIK